MTIRRLDPAQPFREDIVRELRALLERAERGEFRAMMVMVETGDAYESIRAGESDTARRVGMLEMAKHALLHASRVDP